MEIDAIYGICQYRVHLSCRYRVHLSCRYRVHLACRYRVHLSCRYRVYLSCQYRVHLLSIYLNLSPLLSDLSGIEPYLRYIWPEIHMVYWNSGVVILFVILSYNMRNIPYGAEYSRMIICIMRYIWFDGILVLLYPQMDASHYVSGPAL